MTAPSVSVIVCCYSAATTVSETLESLLAQSFSDVEIVAIDDGSKDDTVEILLNSAAKDTRVRVLENPGNKGTAFSRQRGLEEAHAKLVLFFDADDVADPDLIATLHQTLVSDDAIIGVSCYAQYFSDGKTPGTQKIGATSKNEFFHSFENNKLYFQSVVTLFHRDLALQVGGFRLNIMPNEANIRYEDYAEDLDLWCRMADLGAHGRYFLTVKQPLFRYRKPLDSLSTRNLSLMQLKMRWIKDCLLRRRAGTPERCLEEFIATRTLAERVTDWRSDKAALHYKRAAFAYVQRDFVRLFASMAVAGIMSPKLIRQKITTQQIKR